MRRFLIVALLVIATGALAGEFRIDGSSASSTEQGVKTMMKGLSADDSLEFTTSLLRIQLSDFSSVTEVPRDLREGLNFEYLSSKLDGLTHEEILELAESSPVSISTGP